MYVSIFHHTINHHLQLQTTIYIPGFVTPSVISSALDINPQQIQVLLDLLGAVLHDRTLLQRAEDGSPTAVDVYPLVLFLLSHYYTRDAMKLDTADIWPSDHPSTHQLEPSSPMRLIQALSKDQGLLCFCRITVRSVYCVHLNYSVGIMERNCLIVLCFPFFFFP